VAFPGLKGLTAGIARVSRANDNVFLDGQGLAEGLFGDSMATNLFMVGVAFQAGALPLLAASIETAIQQAGVGVEMGLAAFRWGRMAVVDHAFVQAEASKSTAPASVSVLSPAPALSAPVRALVDSVAAQGGLKRVLEIRVPELIAYQNIAYATRYTEVIRRVTSAEKTANVGDTSFSEAAARYLYKLMAYKDEYEVARLHTDPAFLAKLDAQFKAGYKAQYHLAPPLISKRDPLTGELQKRAFGPWIFTAFKLLAKMKFLRGSKLDIFGKTEERRHEQQMIEDYIQLLDEVAAQLTPANYAAAVLLVSVPDEIRGYGHVKEKSIAAAKVLQAQRLQAFRQSRPVVLAA
jgi:indolepyruvate ferredoxin oxidoreductase